MNSVKEENLLSRHAKFLIKELLMAFDCMKETDYDQELRQKMFDLQERLR